MHNQATPPVKIIGVGGAGSRVVTLLVRDGLGSVEFLQLDANSQDWDSSVGPERLLIGEHTRPRPFCRLNSQWVHRAMRDDEKSVREALAGAGLLIVVAGMGGNIASAAPIVARMGKE